jgi:RNA ligase (TIGR02306 family)
MSMDNAIDDEDRALVTIERITALHPIQGADFIETARVRGWSVVVKKGEFAVGDSCLYFEIDSLLPLDDERFAFLAPRGEKLIGGVRYHRLKTARLRGVYSQGLIVPLEAFQAEVEQFAFEAVQEMYPGPVDLAEYLRETLGVLKYTEELPDSAVGPFRALIPKTSAERVQNLAAQWDAVLAAGPWVATEKIDGISCTVFRDPDGAVRVYGRNWEVGDGDNPYWNATRKYQLGERLFPRTGVQFEIFGVGTGRPDRLAVGELRIAVYTYIVGNCQTPLVGAGVDEWPVWLREHAVPVLLWQLPGSADAAIAQVEKMRSLINPAKQAEGVVWHQAAGRSVPELGYRSTLKAINNSYLLKNQD